ncbi:MAG: hypothetical protein ACI84D_000646 [Thalassolituus oleivorans]
MAAQGLIVLVLRSIQKKTQIPIETMTLESLKLQALEVTANGVVITDATGENGP